MTLKKKLDLVVAQYAGVARSMTRSADMMAELARNISEAQAENVLKTLEAEGLIDKDGVLTLHNRVAAVAVKSVGGLS